MQRTRRPGADDGLQVPGPGPAAARLPQRVQVREAIGALVFAAEDQHRVVPRHRAVAAARARAAALCLCDVQAASTIDGRQSAWTRWHPMPIAKN